MHRIFITLCSNRSAIHIYCNILLRMMSKTKKKKRSFFFRWTIVIQLLTVCSQVLRHSYIVNIHSQSTPLYIFLMGTETQEKYCTRLNCIFKCFELHCNKTTAFSHSHFECKCTIAYMNFMLGTSLSKYFWKKKEMKAHTIWLKHDILCCVIFTRFVRAFWLYARIKKKKSHLTISTSEQWACREVCFTLSIALLEHCHSKNTQRTWT